MQWSLFHCNNFYSFYVLWNQTIQLQFIPTQFVQVICKYVQSKFWIDLSPFKWNFDLDKPGQNLHHSLKEHYKINNILKFRCEIL
jgi:hypothetical protein